MVTGDRAGSSHHNLLISWLAVEIPKGILTDDELLTAERSRELLLTAPWVVDFNFQRTVWRSCFCYIWFLCEAEWLDAARAIAEIACARSSRFFRLRSKWQGRGRGFR